MHAAIVRTFGETPTFGEFEEPVAREGELPVKVAAAGLHPIVKALASGTHYGSTGGCRLFRVWMEWDDLRMVRVSSLAAREARLGRLRSGRWRRRGCVLRCRMGWTM
jgi:hypothetical protein